MSSDAQIAREWAEYITSVRELHGDYAPQARAAARFILATTRSLTMAEAEWDNYVHAGLCAEHPLYGLVRMMREVEEGETIDCILPDMSLLVIRAEELTPLPGTRVDLAPRREPEPEYTPSHPAVLTTKEDYENAPTGTVVAEDDASPWIKDDMGFWIIVGDDESETSWALAGIRRRVLRWGWEA